MYGGDVLAFIIYDTDDYFPACGGDATADEVADICGVLFPHLRGVKLIFFAFLGQSQKSFPVCGG